MVMLPRLISLVKQDFLFSINYNQSIPMPRMCTICGKTYSRTIKRSHSMRPSIKRLQPNLQWMRVANGERVKACTRCMKTQNKKSVVAA